MKKDKSKALHALTCAAMGLPGMISQTASAETPPDKTTASYRFTQYSEADQPGTALSGGNTVPRYDISVHQFLLTGAASEQQSYSIAIATESMSGASPWFITAIDGEAVQVMSGATIEESRLDLNTSIEQYFKSYKVGLGIGYSGENDYESISGSVGGSIWLNDKNTTLDLSLGISSDDIVPTDSDIFSTRPEREDKRSFSGAVGVSHVVNKNLLLGTSFNYALYDGFLSDPYKLAYVINQTQADSRPDIRKQAAINFQARQFVAPLNAALHADYRFFSTDWGTLSHTLNVAWYQNIHNFQIVPRLRIYNQSEANFYRAYYTAGRADGFYSSDYRLSAYNAISFRIKGTWKLPTGALHLAFETYSSSGSGDDPKTGENPGLVDFSFVNLGFDFRW